MGLEIVQARDSDTEQITELWKELIDYHRELDAFYSRRADGDKNFGKYLSDCLISEDCLAIVAVEDDKVLGYSISQISRHPPVLETEDFGLITDMAVKSGYRKKGIGSALLMETLDWFALKGVGRIELHVAAANPIGNSFWTKHGFKDYEHVLYLSRKPHP
jgi:ribosomal protein S18 acetylase RimI-like enzyme